MPPPFRLLSPPGLALGSFPRRHITSVLQPTPTRWYQLDGMTITIDVKYYDCNVGSNALDSQHFYALDDLQALSIPPAASLFVWMNCNDGSYLHARNSQKLQTAT